MRNRTAAILLSLLWAALACNKPAQEVVGELGFDTVEVIISADAGKGTAKLTANGPWRVSRMPEWLGYVKPDRGEAGTTELTFGGRFYDGSSSRSSEVTIVCGSAETSIRVTQQAKLSFSVTPSSITDFSAVGGTVDFSVTSPFGLRCETPEWVSCPFSFIDDGDTDMKLTIAPNPGEARSGEIRLYSTEESFEHIVRVTQKCNEILAERHALEDIFGDCDGQSWTRSDNWGTSKPVDQWYGVSVNADGHVIGLDLANNNLSGSLPDSIVELTFLEELYLYGNRLSGSLPKDMRLMKGWEGFKAASHIYPQGSGYGFCSVDSEVSRYQKASRGKGIDIVILGDAFDNSGLELGKGFDALVEKTISSIFAIEPLKSCREYFNVYAVSAESSSGEISTNPGNTAFGTYFTSSDFTVVTMNTNWEKVFQYVGKAPVADFKSSMIVLLANTQRFGGTTLSWDDGRRLSIVPDFQGSASSTEAQYGFAGLVQHEAVGHAFGLFDEEYHTNGLRAPESFVAELALKHAKGISLNISANEDIARSPWAEFAGKVAGVGIHEGAGNYSYGVYRSEKDCCMVDNRPYFSAWCRYLLWKRIRTISEEDSSIESFIEFEKK